MVAALVGSALSAREAPGRPRSVTTCPRVKAASFATHACRFLFFMIWVALLVAPCPKSGAIKAEQNAPAYRVASEVTSVPGTENEFNWSWAGPRSIEVVRENEPIEIDIENGRHFPRTVARIDKAQPEPRRSPSGKWWYWANHLPRSRGNECIVVAMQEVTSNVATSWLFPLSEDEQFPQFVPYPSQRKLVFFTRRSAGYQVRILDARNSRKPSLFSWDLELDKHAVFGIDAKGRLVGLEGTKTGSREPFILVTTLTLERSPKVGAVRIPLPAGVVFENITRVAISPDGRWLAWECDTPSGARTEEEYANKSAGERGYAREIWISNVDGSGFRRLVSLPYKPSHPLGVDYHRSLSWSPDSKRVAFYYDNSIRWCYAHLSEN